MFEDTSHVTASTAVVQNLSFTKEEVLTTQNMVNYLLSRDANKHFHDLLESLIFRVNMVLYH